MKQSYHSSAVTDIHIRNEIYDSNLKNSEIAQKFRISESTVSKWKSRKKTRQIKEEYLEHWDIQTFTQLKRREKHV